MASPADSVAATRAVPRDPPHGPAVDAFLRSALDEDVRDGDVTTEAAVAPEARASARLVAKAPGVIAGVGLFRRVFELLAPEVEFGRFLEDGTHVAEGDLVGTFTGSARALLTGERTALNLLQRLSGIATLTRRYVEAAAGGARILDTRKTTPGLRLLEKYAVRCGGGENHRIGLFDEAMIKDNHLDASGSSIAELVAKLRERHGGMRITVEARDEAEARAAVQAGADVVLLDNLPDEELTRLTPILRESAAQRGSPVELEASGGIDLSRIPSTARTGVDRISIGALTHSAPALDLSLAVEMLPGGGSDPLG
ncbi:MAG TPA: carboxylating nicotinate-nucleotide diphosphorylase [Planctomycetes bacterium]|nr:carboxylating nicotinate-nucleotide diphosphorylase [Planctomycetota bacterium]